MNTVVSNNSIKPINPDAASVRGYLVEDFRLFYLKSIETGTIAPHYHDFHKIIFFEKGKLDYVIEGRLYRIMPGDILVVPANAIHQPIIAKDEPYERYIVWIKKAFIKSIDCEEIFSSSYRINNYNRNHFSELLKEFFNAINSAEYAAKTFSQSLLTQLIINVYRAKKNIAQIDNAYSDSAIDKIIIYINENLSEDLHVENLSKKFFISPSRLLHKFKEITGCTLHQYILQKRLILAAQLLDSDVNANEAATKCGFTDYSTFYRAFKKIYGASPSRM